MLCQSYDITAQQCATVRWKEWIPLTSQQLRLRSLIQIIAFNVDPDSGSQNVVEQSTQRVKSKQEKAKTLFYYTLHLTTMSAPFYTSEKLDNANPKWSEIEMSYLLTNVNAAVTGIIVRLWLHREKEQDSVISVWGVYFNGLVYLGPKLSSVPSDFRRNSVVFHMHGGYFTAVQCLKQPPSKRRNTKVDLSPLSVKPSYNVNSLLRLHAKQQAIKKHVLAAVDLREKISVGGFTQRSNENAVLRRLLNESRPKAPKRQEVLKARQQVELMRFRVELLTREKARKVAQLQRQEKVKEALQEDNEERGLELLSRYQNLHKDVERLKERRKIHVESRELFLHASAQLMFRRKQLISELNQIYPIVQISENKFTICGVCLPNSDVFTGSEDVSVFIALGFVAHLVQMISIFLHVPLRYPIVHFSSRSRIIDHVAERIPDNEREFPLFSKGKDKLQFNYGVYLLNKNIAQLRWYWGITTRDLPATLPNVAALLLHKPGANGLEVSHRSMSGSSLDLRSSSQNPSPVGSFVPSTLRRKGHRVTKSIGSSELAFPLELAEPAEDLTVVDVGNSAAVTNNLSYSLDKGLDEYEDIKKAEVTLKPQLGVAMQQRLLSSTGLLGSEPILTSEIHDKMKVLDVRETNKSEDQAQKEYLQSWHAGGGQGHLCSDDDFEGIQRQTNATDKSVINNCKENPKDEDNKSGIATEGDSEDQNAADNSSNSSKCDTLAEKPADNILQAKTLTEETASLYSLIHDTKDGLALEHLPSQIVEHKSVQDELNVQTSEDIADECFVADIHLTPSTQLQSESEQVQSAASEDGSNSVKSDLQILDGINDMFIDDKLFANVASRTEALANRKTSFNRVRSRNSGSLDESSS